MKKILLVLLVISSGLHPLTESRKREVRRVAEAARTERMRIERGRVLNRAMSRVQDAERAILRNPGISAAVKETVEEMVDLLERKKAALERFSKVSSLYNSSLMSLRSRYLAVEDLKDDQDRDLLALNAASKEKDVEFAKNSLLELKEALGVATANWTAARVRSDQALKEKNEAAAEVSRVDRLIEVENVIRTLQQAFRKQKKSEAANQAVAEAVEEVAEATPVVAVAASELGSRSLVAPMSDKAKKLRFEREAELGHLRRTLEQMEDTKERLVDKLTEVNDKLALHYNGTTKLKKGPLKKAKANKKLFKASLDDMNLEIAELQAEIESKE